MKSVSYSSPMVALDWHNPNPVVRVPLGTSVASLGRIFSSSTNDGIPRKSQRNLKQVGDMTEEWIGKQASSHQPFFLDQS